MITRTTRGMVSGNIADDHTDDVVVGRVFCRHWTVPPAPNTLAPILTGYKQKPVIRFRTPSLQIPYGPNTEQAQWFDPTDLKGESRKVVFP